jgi:hypothetical protein
MVLLGRSGTQTVDREVEPVAAVDAALAMASRSRMVSLDHALRLLHGVEAAIGDRDGRIAAIVADASDSYAGQVVLDRDRLVDTLLDLRLVLSD